MMGLMPGMSQFKARMEMPKPCQMKQISRHIDSNPAERKNPKIIDAVTPKPRIAAVPDSRSSLGYAIDQTVRLVKR